MAKTFRSRHGDEAQREWLGLTLLARHAPGLAPGPLERQAARLLDMLRST